MSSISHKMLSVSQLTKDLNCTTLMYLDFCLIQDILTKKIIGRGTKNEGLYYMDDFKMGQTHDVGQSGNSRIEQIWLWHRRLDHLSFGYLKHLLPNLFFDFSISDFQCETYILAKSHWAIYSLHNNKSDVPFSLIHSNVWGPSPKSTISGYR